MLFESQSRGKVIINIKESEGKISSMVERKGIASDKKTALGAVLATYISMCNENGKDPEKLLAKNLKQLAKHIRDSQE